MHKIGDIIIVAGLGKCRITEVFPMYATDDKILGQICTGVGVEKVADDDDDSGRIQAPPAKPC